MLDVVLDKLNEFLESTKELKDHVFSAMIYPTILLFVGGVSIIILLIFVVPRFSVIFSELGSALPATTQILLAASKGMKSYWWAGLSMIVIGVWAFVRIYIRSESRADFSGIAQTEAPMVGVSPESSKQHGSAGHLGTLLKSGVSLLQALNNAKDVMSNQVIASAIDAVSKGSQGR